MSGFSFNDIYNAYTVHIVVLIGINIIMATSLNLIIGYTGQFNLGHAGFMALGAYSSAAFSVFAGPYLLSILGWSPLSFAEHVGFMAVGAHSSAAWLPASVAEQFVFIIAILLGGLAAALSGLALGLPTLRLRGDYLAIATLGFGEIIQVVIDNTKSVGGATGFTGIPRYSSFFSVYLCAALTLWVVGRMTRSSKGLSFKAIREDEIAALSLGIWNTRVKVTAFVTGAFFAGVGGALFAHFNNYLNSGTFNFLKSIEYVVMVVLGGMGNLWGVGAAAIFLTILSAALRRFSVWRTVIYSLLIIVIMIARSKGIAWKFWKKKEKGVSLSS